MVFVDMFVGRILNENREPHQTYASKAVALALQSSSMPIPFDCTQVHYSCFEEL